MSEQSQVLKFGATVLQNVSEVPPEVMQWWIENPLELQEFLAGLSKKPCPKSDIWRTIKLGTGPQNADDFRKALKDNGFRIGDYANDILGKPAFTVATEETEADLVKVTVAELGFKNGAQRDQIYDRAKKLGLEICPPEVGPQLRLQYKDQSNGEWLLIGMEPIRHSGGGLRVFGVEHGADGLWLYSYYDKPGFVWGADSPWVFVRPRKCQK